MDFQLKKFQKKIEIHLEGHPPLAGTVFLNEIVYIHEGSERVVELLESTGTFFPFQNEAGETLMVRKSAIQKAVVDSEFELEFVHRLGLGSFIEKKVSVMLTNGNIERGRLYIEPKEGASRVQDEVNREGGFIRLSKGEMVHLIGTSCVATIQELPAEEEEAGRG